MAYVINIVCADCCDVMHYLPFCLLLKLAYFRQHGCSTNDTNAKYNSRAAQMYREKIRQQANAALSKYGTDVSMSQGETVHIQPPFNQSYSAVVYQL